MVTEIEVTPEMIEAGLDELREHHYESDTRYMLESVFRAMAYAQLSPLPSSAAPDLSAEEDDTDPWLCRHQPSCGVRDPQKVVECMNSRKANQPCPWNSN